MKDIDSFLDEVFSAIPSTTKVHGFALANARYSGRYPFYSVDSSTWMHEMRALCATKGQAGSVLHALTPSELIGLVVKKYERLPVMRTWAATRKVVDEGTNEVSLEEEPPAVTTPAKAKEKTTMPRSAAVAKKIDDDVVTERPARPFAKAAGGKTKLLPVLLEHVPLGFNRYFEPFVGGGALFFALRNRIDSAVLSDANIDLVRAWCGLQANVEDVIKVLSTLQNDADEFEDIRKTNPNTLTLAEQTARYIYLSRVCFNGLWRVNKKGEFNVPFGRYPNPCICDGDNLRKVAKAIDAHEVAIMCADFEKAADEAREGDFVYFDPPYLGTFSDYTYAGFDENDHRRLAACFRKLTKRKVQVLLSNSDTPLVRELYAGFRIHSLSAANLIGAKASSRGRREEVLVRNYPVPGE